MNKNDNNKIDVQQQQYTNGVMYYPQYYYPQYTQAGTTQPMSVNFASNNKKKGQSTGLTVLKVIATLLFIALTVGIGILAWKAYKKADKTMDKANEKMDVEKKNYENIKDLFEGNKKLVINSSEYTIGLKEAVVSTSPGVS